MDAGAGGGAKDLGRIAARLLATDEVDAVLLVLAATRTLDPDATLHALAEARRAHPQKPMVGVLLGGLEGQPLPGVTVLPSVDSAIRSLSHAVWYDAWLRTPRTAAPVTDPARLSVVRRWVDEHVERTQAGWLGPADAAALLSPYDVAPSGVLAKGPAGAAAAAAEVGLPVAVKVADPHVVHKTERGLVKADLPYLDHVRSAVEGFGAEVGDPDVEVLVQPMAHGIAVALGVVRDPGLGPLVMVAAGGTATEVLDDRRLLLAPVSAQDAARALRSLRIWTLLAGYRGSEPVDEQALVELIVALGRLAVDVPELVEADLNPVVATPQGVELVDVKLRLDRATSVDAGIPRRLRDAD